MALLEVQLLSNHGFFHLTNDTLYLSITWFCCDSIFNLLSIAWCTYKAISNTRVAMTTYYKASQTYSSYVLKQSTNDVSHWNDSVILAIELFSLPWNIFVVEIRNAHQFPKNGFSILKWRHIWLHAKLISHFHFPLHKIVVMLINIYAKVCVCAMPRETSLE